MTLQPLPASAKEKLPPIAIADVINRVIEQGYSDVREIELSNNGERYEIEAFDRHGNEVKIKMDAKTGTILRVKQDND